VNKLRVRMHRQGLGDCFLLTYSADEHEATHLLIDCGVLKGTPDAEQRMKELAEGVHEETGGRLDVLVATHEHWDHLSGFLQAEPIFNTVDVGEVWLAWTEDPQDEVAQELRRKKAKRKQGIVAAAKLAGAEKTPAARRTARQLNALLSFEGDLSATGTKTTARALEWVKDREAQVRYLHPGDQLFEVPSLPGIRVYVLGPPHDSRLIKRSDPSKAHPEVYEVAGPGGSHEGFLAASEALAEGATPEAQPFDPFFRVEELAAAQHDRLFNQYYANRASWRRIDHDWLGYGSQLALQLDSDTNNTSLVLAFELVSEGSVLLFPGDAQVGNWLSWEALEWSVKEGGGTRTVNSGDLLRRTVLYKVGHHASHNATLREKGLELMTSGELTAMIPVNHKTAEKMDWLMPFPALLRRLVEKTNGRVIDAELGLDDAKPHKLPAAAWGRFLARTDVQPGWIDYTIEWSPEDSSTGGSDAGG
jgi:glyoxylase-like metal-dependent hydrolase (beta-lactamase superfamily II)